jgi:lipoate-protein ligase B
MVTLRWQYLGRHSYPDVLQVQEYWTQRKQREPAEDIVLFVEHHHVYTLGRGGDETNVVAPKDVPVYRTSRGGDVTYHGLGQLVVYPIIDLRSKLRKDVHRYVKNLEQSAILALADFGIAATRRPPFTGTWIGDKKIGAIGIAVRRCITYHGLALNVNTDLSYFERIIPCGLPWADVTSMARELGTEQSMEDVRNSFIHHFAEIFGYTKIEKVEDGERNIDDPDSRSSIFAPRPPATGTSSSF